MSTSAQLAPSRATSPLSPAALRVDRRSFLMLQAGHVALFALVAGGYRPELLVASGAVSIVLYGLLLLGEVRRQAWVVTPLFLYVVTSLVRLGATTIYLGVAYATGVGQEVDFAGYDPTAFLGRGHLLLLAGDWMFLAGYFAVERIVRAKRNAAPLALRERSLSPLVAAALTFLALGWLVRIAGMYEYDLLAFGRLAQVLERYGSPTCIFLLTAVILRYRGPKAAMFLLLGGVVVAELVRALQGFAKQDTIIVLLPLAVFFVQRVKTGDSFHLAAVKKWLPSVLVAYVVLMVLFPYNAARRAGTDYLDWGREAETLPFLEKTLAAAVPGTEAFDEVHRFPCEGLWTFFWRNDWCTPAAWIVDQVETNGTIAGEGLYDGLIAIVPRLFWPDKPLIDPGRRVAVLLGQADSFETASTSTGIGLAASLYWNGDWPLLAVGMCINGFLLGFTWELIRPHLFHNPVAALIYLALLLGSLSWFEAEADGCISFYAYIYVVYVPLMMFFRPRTSAASAPSLCPEVRSCA